MQRPPALLFDLDGTLVDSAITIAKALSELSAARGGERADLARTRKLVGHGVSVLVRETLGPVASDSDTDVAAFRHILAGIPADPAMVYPGVIDSLQTLTEAGHPCAIVTNKPQRLAELLLEQLGMAQFFGAIVGGDSLAVCKPHPSPLRHAAQALEVMEGPAIMIGDSEVDARAAAAAGMPFVLYLGGYAADRCDGEAVAASFANFSDLPFALASLASELRCPAGSGTGGIA